MTPVMLWVFIGLGGIIVVGASLAASRLLQGRIFDHKIRVLFETGQHDVGAAKLVSCGRYREAADNLVRWRKLDGAAQLLADAGDYEEAAALYTRARQWGMAALLWMRAGLPREAARCYAKDGQTEKAARLYLEHGAPDQAVRLLKRVGSFEAAANIQRATEGDEAALETLREGGLHAQAAQLLFEIGRDDEGHALLAECYDKQGDWDAAANAYEAQGRLEEALARFIKAEKFLRAGALAEQLGRDEQALDLYRRAKGHDRLGQLLARLGRHRDAARAYLLAGRTEAAVENLLEAQDVLSVAKIYERTRREGAALSVLEVERDHPQFRDARLRRARLLERRGDISASRAELVMLVTRLGVSRETLDIVYRVTELYVQQGDAANALKVLERTKRRGLSDPELDERIARLRQAVDRALGTSRSSPALSIAAALPQSERYEFLHKLGEGGMGAVYRARDLKLGRLVAIKLLLEGDLPTDQAKEYFFREARTVSQLSHRNIVALFDYGEMGSHSFIAMEYVEGQDLEQMVSEGRKLPLRRFSSICVQLAQALDYAHQQNVIHRDVKLANVMVTEDLVVKLMDFGLAKAVTESPDRSLVVIGTPYYMAPEQIAQEEVDHRTDIYAMGIVMFRLLTGHLPFVEGDVLRAQRYEPPPDPLSLNPDLPRPLVRLVSQCLEKRREDRPARARDLAAAIQAVCP